MARTYFKANVKEIESLRIARGWSSRQRLAEKAIISLRTIDSIMAGENALLSTFTKIAKAFDVPVESILEDYEKPESCKGRVWEITIQIRTPYAEFDETKDLPLLISELMKRVGGREFWSPETTPGSTIIRIYVEGDQMSALLAAFQAGQLDDLGIVDVKSDFISLEKSTLYEEFAVNLDDLDDLRKKNKSG
jgi:transcriptional regulator with XRE-family HTH domain